MRIKSLLLVCCASVMLTPGFAREPARGPFTVVEASISDMRTALARRQVTSHELVQQYLARIATYEDKFHAALYVNPNALAEADALDRERAQGKLRGPLHGIPVAVKDNIQTTNMPTTGGALAFDGLAPPFEATLVKNLRAAGAIIIAKTGMTELANWVAGPPTPMPGDYNGLGGYGYNPYDPRRDPREPFFDGRPALNTGGSSSGIGTTANFWAANVGTETSGSILNPANQTMLAGIKPTVGRVSRYGVIPITADQDTAGPMAKTVTDTAIMLGVIEGLVDPNDPATTNCARPPRGDYTQFLKADALKGARIGIPRAFFYEAIVPPNDLEAHGGLSPDQHDAMEAAIEVMKRLGATIVDPADIPSVLDPDPDSNLLNWGICGAAFDPAASDLNCSIVLKYGMKRDFNAWLKGLGPAAPVKTLTELREWNVAHERAGAIKYGQANLDHSDDIDLERDRARYLNDRAKDIRLSATHGINEVMKRERLDALIFPGASGSAIAAKPGYPSVIVPFAKVPVQPQFPFPDGFDLQPAPFGVAFTGMACSEPKLLALAYAFEQATKGRVPPPAP
ncbi:MAG TPA: amidase family protein [Micropepsaceae bacterium]|nr:amidase family protein [Micropepsaceae bacterium]